MLQNKRLLAGAMAIVLVTGIVSLAQQPAATSQPMQLPASMVPATQEQFDPNVTQTSLIAPHPFGMMRCETPEGYVCQCETKNKKKVMYSSVCKPFCIPYCHEKCCEGEQCGVVMYKKVLVKKNRTLCNETETKCVPKPICPPCEESK